MLPPQIEEHWRRVFIDVTCVGSFTQDKINKLCSWSVPPPYTHHILYSSHHIALFILHHIPHRISLITSTIAYPSSHPPSLFSYFLFLCPSPFPSISYI